MRRDRDAPRLFLPQVTLHAVKIACERPDTCGRSLCLWDCREIARPLIEEAIVPTIRAETVPRMLGAHRLKPWRKRIVARDAVFAACVRQISDFYPRPLEARERVICTDAHPSIPPRPRPWPTRACQPGHPTQVEQEYKRCGALNLLAALDTRSGKVWAASVKSSLSRFWSR